TVFSRIILKESIRGLTGICIQGRELDLDQQRDFAVYQFQDIFKQRDFFLRIPKSTFLKFLISHLTYWQVNAAHPGEGVVMEDHQLFVFGKLDVQFDPVSVFHSIGEGSHGIFRNGLILCKKASVGEEMMEESLGFLLS